MAGPRGRGRGQGAPKRHAPPAKAGANAGEKRARGGGGHSFGRDEELGGDLSDDGSVESGLGEEEPSEPESDLETADEARLRLAKQYLATVAEETKKKEEDDEDDQNFNRDAIAHRLTQDVQEARGRQYLQIAGQLRTTPPVFDQIRHLRGHKLPVTALTLSGDDKIAFTASKDGSILQWDVESGAKHRIHPTEAKFGTQVASLAVSSDGKFLAFGGKDKLVHVWDVRGGTLASSFKGHRDTISCLAFQRGTHELFSGSHDRTIKVWNLDEMCYVETLFGHQAEITGISSLAKERCVSVSRDRSLRLWKVVEESQLIFRGHSASIDCCAMSTEDWFVAGAADGGLSLWSTLKKKPTAVRRAAHGSDANQIPHWISSVAALSYSNLVASGSCDGFVRLWECSKDNCRLEEVAALPVPGFVNGLAFASSGRFLLAGLGQEHRLGRWTRNAAARNGLAVLPLGPDEQGLG